MHPQKWQVLYFFIPLIFLGHFLEDYHNILYSRKKQYKTDEPGIVVTSSYENHFYRMLYFAGEIINHLSRKIYCSFKWWFVLVNINSLFIYLFFLGGGICKAIFAIKVYDLLLKMIFKNVLKMKYWKRDYSNKVHL